MTIRSLPTSPKKSLSISPLSVHSRTPSGKKRSTATKGEENTPPSSKPNPIRTSRSDLSPSKLTRRHPPPDSSHKTSFSPLERLENELLQNLPSFTYQALKTFSKELASYSPPIEFSLTAEAQGERIKKLQNLLSGLMELEQFKTEDLPLLRDTQYAPPQPLAAYACTLDRIKIKIEDFSDQPALREIGFDSLFIESKFLIATHALRKFETMYGAQGSLGNLSEKDLDALGRELAHLRHWYTQLKKLPKKEALELKKSLKRTINKTERVMVAPFISTFLGQTFPSSTFLGELTDYSHRLEGIIKKIPKAAEKNTTIKTWKTWRAKMALGHLGILQEKISNQAICHHSAFLDYANALTTLEGYITPIYPKDNTVNTVREILFRKIKLHAQLPLIFQKIDYALCSDWLSFLRDVERALNQCTFEKSDLKKTCLNQIADAKKQIEKNAENITTKARLDLQRISDAFETVIKNASPGVIDKLEHLSNHLDLIEKWITLLPYREQKNDFILLDQARKTLAHTLKNLYKKMFQEDLKNFTHELNGAIVHVTEEKSGNANTVFFGTVTSCSRSTQIVCKPHATQRGNNLSDQVIGVPLSPNYGGRSTAMTRAAYFLTSPNLVAFSTEIEHLFLNTTKKCLKNPIVMEKALGKPVAMLCAEEKKILINTPNLRNQAISLQLLHYLTGQSDGHSNNMLCYFPSPLTPDTVILKTIDHDSSFGHKTKRPDDIVGLDGLEYQNAQGKTFPLIAPRPEITEEINMILSPCHSSCEKLCTSIWDEATALHACALIRGKIEDLFLAKLPNVSRHMVENSVQKMLQDAQRAESIELFVKDIYAALLPAFSKKEARELADIVEDHVWEKRERKAHQKGRDNLLNQLAPEERRTVEAFTQTLFTQYQEILGRQANRGVLLPPVVSQRHYYAFHALTKEDIDEMCQGLTREETEATFERLGHIQSHLNILKRCGSVITDLDWGTPLVTALLFPSSFANPRETNKERTGVTVATNYLQRDFL